MQNTVIDKPYQFIPPLESRVWPFFLKRYVPRYLRRVYGIASVECRQADRLAASVRAGHGILLAPNHCRMSDPLVLGHLARQVGINLFAMASWHLFMQDRFTTFMIRRMGAFSVYREGMDRQAIGAAVSILAEARRPLIVFPEGAVSRHNDRLMALMEGTSFIARSAAKRRAKEIRGGRVVVHPVAIRYFFRGRLESSVEPVLSEIEHRFSWQPQRGRPLLERIGRIAEALLSLKEIEYFGQAQTGDKFQRARNLIDRLLVPLEDEWSIGEHQGSVVARVKRLRTSILAEMVGGQLADAERDRRWRQLADCYLAQQISNYPQDYIRPDDPIQEHVLETVERFEEDLTDTARTHGPWHAAIQVGEAIEVSPKRDKGDADPVMQGIETQLNEMLSELARGSAAATANFS